jgi:DNA polymerase (family 10)
MNSDEIIDALELTAKLMELHNENPFKTKALSNAAFKLSKLRYDFEGKSKEEIENIEGIGKGISAKIIELLATGTTQELSELCANTPLGVIDMLGIKGLGPKKVRQLWLELGLESVGELLYACNENRLTALKGFGEKTQTQVKLSIEFKLSNERKFHYAALENKVQALLNAIQTQQPSCLAIPAGQFARQCEIIDDLQILLSEPLHIAVDPLTSVIPLPVKWIMSNPSDFYADAIKYSATDTHLQQIAFQTLNHKAYASQEEVYEALQLPYIVPELREGLGEVELAKKNRLPKLIQFSDLQGCLHNHSTYSDGVHTLREMADHCRELGYTYFGICDHSKSAGYANGLSIERVMEQHREIDTLNASYNGFRILKGIESDILNDGSLDYPDEVLKSFDFVVASVHSNLKMTEEKATQRLLKAIENPYTSILGHPTGRLLLARPGYPIDHKKVIDACAANGVAIELNAHPYRLDIDWRWIPYCLEKGVKISVNPDAHHKDGFHDMYYGVCVARKGWLTKETCLNALSLSALLEEFKK